MLRLSILLQVVLLKDLVELDLEAGCFSIDFGAVFKYDNSLFLLIALTYSLNRVRRPRTRKSYATLFVPAFMAHLAEAQSVRRMLSEGSPLV